MLILTLLATLAGAVALIYLLFFFDLWVTRKSHGFHPFEAALFYRGGGAQILIYLGWRWYQSALHSAHGDPLNGILLMASGALLFGSLIRINVQKAGWRLGALVTLVQIPVFAAGTLLGLLALLLLFFAATRIRPVFLIG